MKAYKRAYVSFAKKQNPRVRNKVYFMISNDDFIVERQKTKCEWFLMYSEALENKKR